MSEPRRSTRTRAREEAAPAAPEAPIEKETPVKASKTSLKRKRASIVTKDSAPLTPATEGAPLPSSLPPKQTLPLRLLEGQPLPTLSKPQPLNLPSNEWQNIQQSGVLEASLERSRAVWTSGVNFRIFHKHFTQPKKVAERTDEDKANNQRQKEIARNFPQIGGERENVVAQLVIEPHTFPIRLYGPREVIKTAPKKVPTSNYGPWPNHGHHGHHGQPNQYTQYHNTQSSYPKPQPQPRPPPPKPVPATPSTAPTSSPAPDPVIHMLAARAGTDPELKAVMKIVAAGTASKEQLEFFQSHINELTAILARQKEQAAKTAKPMPAPSTPKPAPPAPPPAPKAVPPPLPPAPKIVATPPPPRPVQTSPPSPYQNVPKHYSPTVPQGHMPHVPPTRQPHPPYSNHHHHQPIYRQPQHPPPYTMPQRTSYRPLIFEFVEGNSDKLYFPSYSFLEWLPNGSGIKLSFLITKMKPKPKPDPAVKTPSTPASKAVEAPAPAVSAPPNMVTGTPQTNNATPALVAITPAITTPQAAAPPTPAPAHYAPPQRIEDFDERNDVADIEFYQPVTVLILSTHPDIVHSLPRAVRPPDVVERYMNEVFDKCQRADETYLAFRLPKDGDGENVEKKAKSGDVTPALPTPSQDITVVPVKRGAGRPRKNPL